MKKKQKLIFFALCFVFSRLGALDNAKWTIAASKFDIVDSALMSVAERESLEVISTQLPLLILDSIPLGTNRTVHPDEILERDIYNVQVEQQKQFDSISTIIKNRDALMFSNSGVALKNKIDESKNSLKSAEKKLDESIKEEQNILKKYENKKNKKNTLETIALYQNDGMYQTKNDVISAKEICSSEIRALITGKIYSINGFVQVETEMTQYPSKKVIARASEFGTIREVDYIARTLMNVLLESMINDDVVEVDIFVGPEEAGKNCTVFIEDSVYHGEIIPASFTAGKHTIRVESPGYEVVFFTVDFPPNENKIINIEMQKQIFSDVTFVTQPAKKKSTEQIPSEVYLNMTRLGTTPVVASIKDAVSLGEVVNTNGDTGYFLLKNGMSFSLENENNEETVKMALMKVPQIKENLTKRIDTSRKIMYWSFGAFVITLPVYYFFNGMYKQCQVNSSFIDDSVTAGWGLGSNISMYVMIGVGVNFLAQLIVYLVNANKVIPKTIKAEVLTSEEEEKILNSAKAQEGDESDEVIKSEENDALQNAASPQEAEKI